LVSEGEGDVSAEGETAAKLQHVFETFGTVLDPVPVGNRAFVFLLNAEFDFPFEKFFGAVGKFFGKAGFFRILPGFFRGKAFGFLAPGTGFKPALCGGILALTLLFPQTVFPQEASSDLGRNQAGESIKTFAEKNTCEPAYRQSDEKAGKKRGAGGRIKGKAEGLFDAFRIHILLMFLKCGFWAGLLTGTITGIYIFFPKFARRFLR